MVLTAAPEFDLRLDTLRTMSQSVAYLEDGARPSKFV